MTGGGGNWHLCHRVGLLYPGACPARSCPCMCPLLLMHAELWVALNGGFGEQVFSLSFGIAATGGTAVIWRIPWSSLGGTATDLYHWASTKGWKTFPSCPLCLDRSRGTGMWPCPEGPLGCSLPEVFPPGSHRLTCPWDRATAVAVCSLTRWRPWPKTQNLGGCSEVCHFKNQMGCLLLSIRIIQRVGGRARLRIIKRAASKVLDFSLNVPSLGKR